MVEDNSIRLAEMQMVTQRMTPAMYVMNSVCCRGVASGKRMGRVLNTATAAQSMCGSLGKRIKRLMTLKVMA